MDNQINPMLLLKSTFKCLQWTNISAERIINILMLKKLNQDRLGSLWVIGFLTTFKQPIYRYTLFTLCFQADLFTCDITTATPNYGSAKQ